MQDRMPFTLITIPDPLVTDSVQDDEPNDSRAVSNYLWNEYVNGRARTFRCEVARGSTPARQGGRQPADEPHETLTCTIPGEIPFSVKVTDVALLLEEPEGIVYTIINLSVDRIGYFSYLTMEEFGHRA